jgi:hypothetical protein
MNISQSWAGFFGPIHRTEIMFFTDDELTSLDPLQLFLQTINGSTLF